MRPRFTTAALLVLATIAANLEIFGGVLLTS